MQLARPLDAHGLPPQNRSRSSERDNAIEVVDLSVARLSDAKDPDVSRLHDPRALLASDCHFDVLVKRLRRLAWRNSAGNDMRGEEGLDVRARLLFARDASIRVLVAGC